MKDAEEQFLEKWNECGYPGSDITREFRFHPTRRWRFDFAFPSRRVAIEIDGRGRHQTVAGVRADCEKSNAAIELGWAVLRIPTSDIRGKDKCGEPLVELFIELVCRVLSTREVYESNERVVHPRVDRLQEVSTTQDREKPRTVQGNNARRRFANRGSTRKD